MRGAIKINRRSTNRDLRAAPFLVLRVPRRAIRIQCPAFFLSRRRFSSTEGSAAAFSVLWILVLCTAREETATNWRATPANIPFWESEEIEDAKKVVAPLLAGFYKYR